MLFSEGVQKFV